MSLSEKDQTEVNLHTHTIIKLKDVMGSDSDIEEAARCSYGHQTRKVSETRGLLRYLMKHRHTSPFEMGEVKFYLKMPIFCMRQFVRHRTANLNEYSARYSVMKDEFYLPSFDYMQPQSTTNKQGREGTISYSDKSHVLELITAANESAKQTYHSLLDEQDSSDQNWSDDYEGISRELARIVMPVAAYTELYWKCDLHNFFHMAKLRMDPHAQQEIRDIAQAMYDMVKPYFPIACEAFEDYVLNAKTFSAMEMKMIRGFFSKFRDEDSFGEMEIATPEVLELNNMTQREWTDFRNKLF